MKALLFPTIGLGLLLAVSHWGDEPPLLVDASTSDAVATRVVPANTLTGPNVLYPKIHQVICDEGKGSAFEVEGDRLVSVAHVTGLTGCKVEGTPIEAVQDEGKDFSVIKRAHGGGYKINCEGFHPGEYYFAVGYAYGWSWQTMILLRATANSIEGQHELIGSVIPGMSGTIVANAGGEAVGTVNRYNIFYPLSYSQPLSETSLCRRKA